MARALIFLIVLALLVASTGAIQERAPGVQRLRFEIEVDLERARRIGWTAPDEEALVELASRIVQERLLAMHRAVQIEVLPDTKHFRLSLPSIDEKDSTRIPALIRCLSVCEFLFVAEGEEVDGEKQRLASWRTTHPDAPLCEFNALDPTEGGPANGLAWFETQFGDESGKPVLGAPILVRLPEQLADHIGEADFKRTYATLDSYGYPAIGFELLPARTADFARVTEAHVGGRMAIVLDGRVRSAPSLHSKLVGAGIIEGRFTAEEAAHFAKSLPELKGPLRLVEAR